MLGQPLLNCLTTTNIVNPTGFLHGKFTTFNLLNNFELECGTVTKNYFLFCGLIPFHKIDFDVST